MPKRISEHRKETIAAKKATGLRSAAIVASIAAKSSLRCVKLFPMNRSLIVDDRFAIFRSNAYEAIQI